MGRTVPNYTPSQHVAHTPAYFVFVSSGFPAQISDRLCMPTIVFLCNTAPAHSIMHVQVGEFRKVPGDAGVSRCRQQCR